MKMQVFVGAYQSKTKSNYAVSIHSDGNSVQLDPVVFASKITKHRLLLLALVDVLNNLIDLGKGWEVDFFSDDYSVWFEWDQEYCKERKFYKNDDIDVWTKIVKLVENNEISLTIYGDDTALSKLNKNQKRRARYAE